MINEILGNTGVAIGVIACCITGIICYTKGVSDGLKKNNEDIERMLDRAIKRAKETNNETRKTL